MIGAQPTDLDLTALAEWLGARLEARAPVRIVHLDPPKSGFSAETTVLTVTYERDGRRREERVVLRREVPDPAVYPQQVPGLDVEVEIQYRS